MGRSNVVRCKGPAASFRCCKTAHRHWNSGRPDSRRRSASSNRCPRFATRCSDIFAPALGCSDMRTTL
eukprot:5306531-Pleurochrysis_carterae.AAC.1